ncbi:PIR protein [Plasmodium vivax]|nr:PIR protein [Plasmodium vivax]
MDDNKLDYDSFEQYKYNHGVYEKIRGDIGNEYNSFPKEILREQTENTDSITMDCLRIKKYLMNFNSKEKCKQQNCCQYINYLLNKRVREDYGSKGSIFDIYNKYMNHENNNMIKNLCLTEINYMNQEIYNKIDQLYNAYYTCKYYIPINNDRIKCNYANFCANAYNNITTEYIKQDDVKFCKTLKDLKDVIEENERLLTSDCDSKISDSLYYPYECIDILPKSEEMTASMERSNGGSELPGALGEPSEEQRQETSEVGSLGVRAPGLRASAIGGPEGGNDTGETANLIPTQSDSNDINAESPSAKTPTPVGTIIGTSLGFVLPLITIYRVRKTYLKIKIILYVYLYYV